MSVRSDEGCLAPSPIFYPNYRISDVQFLFYKRFIFAPFTRSNRQRKTLWYCFKLIQWWRQPSCYPTDDKHLVLERNVQLLPGCLLRIKANKKYNLPVKAAGREGGSGCGHMVDDKGKELSRPWDPSSIERIKNAIWDMATEEGCFCRSRGEVNLSLQPKTLHIKQLMSRLCCRCWRIGRCCN